MSNRVIGNGDRVLWLATVAFLVVCGAGTYEHAIVVPVWTADPPASLAPLHGPHGLDTGSFWRIIHLPTFLLEVTALVLLRGQARRRLVALAAGGYAAVIVATLVFYVPELLALIDLNAAIPASEWKARADRWEVLSLGRLAVMFGLSVLLLRAVAEPPTPTRGLHTGEKPA